MQQTITIGGERKVFRMGFGAGRLVGPNFYGEPDDPEQARVVLRRAVELGIELIDTADSYGPEINERQIADALFPYSPKLAIATKAGYTRPRRSWMPDGRPEHLRAACEGSLRRLRLERIDLYQLHRPDPNVPLEESVGALEELRREGKIRHIGLSNVNTAELRDVRKIAPIAAVQNEYNVARRESDDVVDACEDAGIAFLAYFPIDAGALARASGALKSVAGQHGATPAQVALAWLLHRSPAVVPIPGTSSLRHLAENVAATKISLTKENLAVLG